MTQMDRPQYSPIAPVEVLQELRIMGLIANYLLVLPHDVVRNPMGYMELLNTPMPGEAGVGKWLVILDNGAAEVAKGEVVYDDLPKMMLEAAKIVHPDIICLSDIIGDAKASYQASLDSYVMWREMFAKHHFIEGRDFAWMGIPQGNTTDEMLSYVERMSDWTNVDYWGIPRNLANVCGSRVSIVDRIQRDIQLARPIHLLGMSQYLADDIECTRYPIVMGIDSANPLVLGWQGTRITKRDLSATTHIPRGVFWENRSVNDIMCDNICVIQELLADGRR